MSSNFLKIYKNTLASFFKSRGCWILFFSFIVINVCLIILIPIYLGGSAGYLQNELIGELDFLSWIPMGLIFVIMGSFIFNASDNIYILTKSTNRNKLFGSKMLAQFTMSVFFILFYVIIWLIVWGILNQRTIDDWNETHAGITSNIFNYGFTPAAIIVPPLLLALCCVPLSSAAINFSKYGVNSLVGGVFAMCGVIGYWCVMNHVRGLGDIWWQNQIHNFTLVWPCISLSIVALIEYICSYIYINRMNIKI